MAREIPLSGSVLQGPASMPRTVLLQASGPQLGRTKGAAGGVARRRPAASQPQCRPRNTEDARTKGGHLDLGPACAIGAVDINDD